MNQWIVKAGTLSTPTAWTSKPMSMTEAGKLAETLVDASGFYCNAVIEFYCTPIEEPKSRWTPAFDKPFRTCTLCGDSHRGTNQYCDVCDDRNIDEECARG